MTAIDDELSKTPKRDRLRRAQEWARAELDETGYLSEPCRDELAIAAWLDEHPVFVPTRVGTLTPAQLADLDPHDRQAREATEQ